MTGIFSESIERLNNKMLIFCIIYGLGYICCATLLAALAKDMEPTERFPYLLGVFGLSWIWPVLAVWICWVQISLFFESVDEEE